MLLTASRSMARAMVMRKASWLQPSGLLKNVQNTVKDLAFEEPTDDSLHTLKDYRANLRSLGIYVPAMKRCYSRSQTAQQFRPFQYHPAFPKLSKSFRRRPKPQKRGPPSSTNTQSNLQTPSLHLPIRGSFDALVEGIKQTPPPDFMLCNCSIQPTFGNCLSQLLPAWDTSPQTNGF